MRSTNGRKDAKIVSLILIFGLSSALGGKRDLHMCEFGEDHNA